MGRGPYCFELECEFYCLVKLSGLMFHFLYKAHRNVTKFYDNRFFQPLEHKWIVRILLQRLDIGLKHNSILKYYHPLAEDLYAANKSLQSLCTLLSDPEWVKRRQSQINYFQQQQRKYHRMNHIPKTAEKAVLGNTITPMLSKRTGFSSAINDMESRHVEFLRSAPVSCIGSDSLALKFPAFMCEEKIDGERMIVHVKRGNVTMHVRTYFYKKFDYII